MDLLNPQVDFVFKRIFGMQENQDVLLSFLNAVFEDSNEPTVSSVEILNPFLEKDAITDKMSVLDVKAKTDDGTLINVEIQFRDHQNMVKRTLYYWAKMFEDQLQQSSQYHQLRKTVTINVVRFSCLPGHRFHTSFHLLEDQTHDLLTDLCEIHFLELEKLPQTTLELDHHLMRWMLFLTAKTRERLEVVAMTEPAVKKAVTVLEYLSQDAKARLLYEERLKGLQTYTSDVEGARLEGREEGRIEGREEGQQLGAVQEKHRTARALLARGFAVPMVAEVTGLSVEDIEALRDQPS